MSLLLRNVKEIRDHWHNVASNLGSILPGAANTYRAWFQEPTGTIASLGCQQYPQETALRSDGIAVPIVPLIAVMPDESPIYWMGWYEEWRPQRTTTSRRLRFHTTAITVYYGESEASKYQLIRAEWAGVENVDENQIDILQGRGAAHPHWHIDAIRSYVTGLKQCIEELSRDADLRRDLAVDRVRVFGDKGAEKDVAGLFTLPSLALPSDRELNWTGIHLAANARWSDREWPGPDGPHDMHASGPVDLPDIRRWLTSCVRYIQAEINKV
jgi:hypothetical protein